MKRKMNNQKGVTLISLVITIIVLLILAGIGITSGVQTIKSSKQTKFTTELKIMQVEANELYDAYKNDKEIEVNGTKYKGEEIKNIGKNITEADGKANEVFTQEASGITDSTGYKYYNEEIIKGLGIDGVENEYFVNVEKRSVVAVIGVEFDEKVCYTVEQLPDGLYNVEYNEEEKEVDFELASQTESPIKGNITVFDITSTKAINKWKVRYRIKGREEWTQTEEFEGTEIDISVEELGTYEVQVYHGEELESAIKEIEVKPIEITTDWIATTKTDSEWYRYTDVSKGDNKKVQVNAPRLKGNMTPIKYIGEEQEGSKWANVATSDGSMFVWIPRYAYKITKGYHTNQAGTIEVAFIDTNNRFLNGESGTIITDPSKVTYTNGVQNEWLVHPVFTASAENGGGFGEIAGLWVGKFEATGTKDAVTVKAGENSLKSMDINSQYKAGKNATFGEKQNLNSHMAKSSEWGATVYLAHSKYGINGQKVERQSSGYITGGNSKKSEIYKTNKKQSTTHNAYGVYDMNGGSWERVASYVNYGNSSSYLPTYGGTESGDLYGTEKERNTSTAYKTVYQASGTNQADNYNLAQSKKGDSIYETSNSNSSSSGSWFDAYTNFPDTENPFFAHGGVCDYNHSGTFSFADADGGAFNAAGFRVVLVP